MTPAIKVASSSPLKPCRAITPATMTTNAPVGPPIWTREPPSAEIRKPATIAVTNPSRGLAPLAIPSAIASGSATTATVSPAIASARRSARPYPSRSTVMSLGVNASPNRSDRPVMPLLSRLREGWKQRHVLRFVLDDDLRFQHLRQALEAVHRRQRFRAARVERRHALQRTRLASVVQIASQQDIARLQFHEHRH